MTFFLCCRPIIFLPKWWRHVLRIPKVALRQIPTRGGVGGRCQPNTTQLRTAGFSIRPGSQRNLPAISRELAAYFSLVVTPSPKPKFNDFCVLFKHSNFCFRKLEIHSKRPRYENFSRSLLVTRVFFPSPPTLKSFPPT